MKVKRIDLDDEENPESVTVQMSHDEAVFIALVLGRMTGDQDEQILKGGSELCSSIYYGLAGGVFNRFYEDGVEEAAQAVRTRA